MIRTELLARQPTLSTPRLRLTPMGPRYLPQVVRSAADPEGRRLTGTHRQFAEAEVRTFLEQVEGNDQRADWAIIRAGDSSFLGEVVLNELDADNGSMNYRIALRGSDVYGQGYGTEAGRAVINFGLAVLGLHRISLQVYPFNERAIASVRKLGFSHEGVLRHALHWEDEWHNALIMSIVAGDPVPD